MKTKNLAENRHFSNAEKTITREQITRRETDFATYCPEDDKLRLYVGRVPREEYDFLRAEGWTSTPKQSEAGQGEFAAVWTVSRELTALAYSPEGVEDEDAGPEERAADRAARFGGYREKREAEATGHADRYDGQPLAHGFQSEAKAARAAARHDRIGDRAVDQWSRAEYWQRRTAGVISNALYKSSPAVRMGRIKTLEDELRKAEASLEKYARLFENMKKIAEISDPEKQTEIAINFIGSQHIWAEYKHPRPADIAEAVRATGHERAQEMIEGYTTRKTSLYSLIAMDYAPITGAEACALFFSNHHEPKAENKAINHLKMRLCYENQMLDAQGGRAAFVEMEIGGWIRGGRHLSNEERQIVKVNKSPATGRVVSVDVKDNRPSSVNHWGNPFPEGVTKTLIHNIKTERLPESAYRPPTDEEREAFHARKKAEKDAKPEVSFVNPTKEDAEKLQSKLNKQAAEADKEKRYPRAMGEVKEMTQARYSATYKDYKKTDVIGTVKLRFFACGWSSVSCVVVLTDKPQKPLPKEILEPEQEELSLSAQ